MNTKKEANPPPSKDTKDLQKTEEDQIPKEKPLEEIQLPEIIKSRENLFIIDKLRQGPIERSGLHKLIKAKFARLDRNPRAILEDLIQKRIIFEYEYKKTVLNPDQTPHLFPDMQVGDTHGFYLLITDFYAIRKPPIKILEMIDTFGYPGKMVKQYRQDIKKFFNKYANLQALGDDPDVLEVFLDPKLLSALNYLSEKVYPLTELTTQITSEGTKEPQKIISKLKEKDFIQIMEIPEQKGSFVLLKAAAELQSVFPEYLIRGVNQAMADKKMDKEFAIQTLYCLKRAYLELREPEMLANIQERVAQIREKLLPLLEKWKTGDKSQVKQIEKLLTQLLDSCKEMADIPAINQVSKDLEEIRPK